MAYELGKINLNPFSKVVSTAGTEGMANIPSLENKALLALERSKYWNEKEREANKIWAGVNFPTQPVPSKSWGSVAAGILGTANQAGLFDNFGGNQFSGRGSSGTDSFGRDFDNPWATPSNTGLIVDPFGMDSTYGGTTTEWNTDMPVTSGNVNPWYNPFGWGS